MRGWLAIALASLGVAGCADPPSLLVVVASDYEPGAITSVVVETFDDEGQSVDRREVAIGGAEGEALPFSFAARRRDAGRPLRIEARGALASGGSVTSRAIVPPFSGGPRRLVLFLARACEDVACDGETTCVAGVCADAHVPESALEPVEPGHELDLDAGPPAPPDAGVEPCRGTPLECDAPTRVAVGADFACAIRFSERVACWGSNERGQLGDGTTTPSDTPVDVSSVIGARVLHVGDRFACAQSEAAVECWGDNTLGQLGRSDTTASSPSPASVQDVSSSEALYGGPTSACVQLGADTRCWGTAVPGANAPLADRCGDVPCARAPEPQPDLAFVDRLAAGKHACGLSDGRVLCAGPNEFGQLGAGTREASATLVPVASIGYTEAVVVGARSSCATREGSVDCWGANDLGQLGAEAPDTCSAGAGSVACALAPVALALEDVAELVMGATTTCARRSSGAVVCWGDDRDGALGDGPGAPDDCTDVEGARAPCARAPRAVVGLSDALRLGAHGSTFCAVRVAGTVACWGAGYGEAPVEIRFPPR